MARVANWFIGPHGRVVGKDRTMDFYSLGFAAEYAIDFSPEYPGNGDWGCPVFGFSRAGTLLDPFRSPWGTAGVIAVRPTGGDEWVGMFEAGGLGGASGAFGSPGSTNLCIATDGAALILDVREPGHGALVVSQAVQQVASCPAAGLLLLVRIADLIGVNTNGVAWRTRRLGVENLRVVSSDAASITCTVDNLGGTPTITLDPATGDQTGGTRFESYWPPDALA